VRYPGLTHDQALKIRDFAGNQLEKDYDFKYGLFRQAAFRLEMKVAEQVAKIVCRGVGNPMIYRHLMESFRNKLAIINLGTGTNDKWFCSELVLAAYAAAGAPLTAIRPHWVAPVEILNLQKSGDLEYVGHLKI
jgi:hypothetical protein